MARSHHRKKHKEHLRQYQQHQDSAPARRRPAKGKITGTIAVIGVILGVAVGYFATDGVLLWVAFGALAGGLAGYLTGRYLDKQEK